MDKKRPDLSIALIGSPNTGKTTIFNGLTGMRCHTGNWNGKTAAPTQGSFSMNHQTYLVTDLPGIYSPDSFSWIEKKPFHMFLMILSPACLEQNLCLLKKLLSLDYIKDNRLPVILCINFRDEAEKKGIEIDYQLLEDVLQIPVLSCCALSPRSFGQIRRIIRDANERHFNYDCLDFCPKQLFKETVRFTRPEHSPCQDITDRITLSPVPGVFLMFFLFLSLSWLTQTCASLPGSLLSNRLIWLETKLLAAMTAWNIPPWLISMIADGFYRSLSWLIFMMMVPLTVFLLLFTLLEDAGCLPRIAFHMDPAFRCCRCCTKQCMTTAMGFVCNAAGISQSASIDSPRERLIAILTNSFVPCSRQLPILLFMISLLFWSEPSITSLQTARTVPVFVSLVPALTLTLLILLSITASLFMSWLLSHTLLRGIPPSFVLELPPLRRPIVHKTILRSLRDLVLPALLRTLAWMLPTVSAVWLTAYFFPGFFCSVIRFLDPPGRLMGLNGSILFAFLMAFPTSEMVIPIILTTEAFPVSSLIAFHGWTRITIVCTMIFCLFHWPCLTTILRIKKETGSWKWTAVSILLPTLLGAGLCMLFSGISAVLPFLP